MRGRDDCGEGTFSHIRLEDRVPAALVGRFGVALLQAFFPVDGGLIDAWASMKSL